MDEAVAALLAVPTILVGLLLMVSVVEGSDRRQQLHTVAHRSAVAAAVGVPADATPSEVRAGVAAGAAAAVAASVVCADRPDVTIEYYDRLGSGWLDPARYQRNTDWAGSPPLLGAVRASVRCWPLPGPLPTLATQVTQASQITLASAPPTVWESPPVDPEASQLQEER